MNLNRFHRPPNWRGNNGFQKFKEMKNYFQSDECKETLAKIDRLISHIKLSNDNAVDTTPDKVLLIKAFEDHFNGFISDPEKVKKYVKLSMDQVL